MLHAINLRINYVLYTFFSFFLKNCEYNKYAIIIKKKHDSMCIDDIIFMKKLITLSFCNE
jgi:hypothetical protein